MSTRAKPQTPDTTPAFELRNVVDPKTERTIKSMRSAVYPTPHKGRDTIVLVHPTGHIAEGVKFGENAGPVGRDSYVGEESVILGALFAQVRLGRAVYVETKARLGTIAEAPSLGHIALEDQAVIKARTRIWSPATDCTTIIGARTVIGEASIIGQEPQSKGHGNNKRVARGEGIVIGEDVSLARRTIVHPGAYIGAGTTIGAGYEVAESVEIPEGICIEDNPLYAINPSARQAITPEWLAHNGSLITRA